MISTGNAYRKITYGILLSACHIIVNSRFEILPAFLGYLLIFMGVKELCGAGAKEYYEKENRTIGIVLILSVIGFIGGIFLGYGNYLSQLCQVAFFLIELLFYADLLSSTRKVLREYNMIREADKMKSDRKVVLLIGMFLSVIRLFAIMFSLLGYVFNLGLIFYKIMLSLQMQKMASMEFTFYKTGNRPKHEQDS